MRRAELHRAHRNYGAAKADFLAVLDGSPRALDVLLALTRLEREFGHHTAATALLAAYFKRGGEAPEAWRESARIHTAQERPDKAAAAWRNYLRRATEPTADEFHAAGSAHLAAGSRPEARALVDDALTRFPRSVPLHQLAATIAIRAGRDSAAEDRFAALRAMYPTLLPRLAYEEGAIWNNAGRRGKAAAAWRLALRHLDELPQHKQAQAGLKKLRHDIHLAIDP